MPKFQYVAYFYFFEEKLARKVIKSSCVIQTISLPYCCLKWSFCDIDCGVEVTENGAENDVNCRVGLRGKTLKIVSY